MSARKKRYCQYSRCGKLITRAIGSKDSGKYCNKSCYFAAIDAGEQKFKGALRGLDWQLASWFLEWDAQKPAYFNCANCGEKTNNTRFCNRKCEGKFRYWLIKPSECVDCGACIAGVVYQSRSRCKTCRLKRRKQLRRTLKKKYTHLFGNYRNRCQHYGVEYDSSVTRKKVFERDRHVCQMCGAQCLNAFKWKGGKPIELSPTVDHIVPLSWRKLGHTWDNVQCACWSCNTAKRNMFGGQLRLVLQ
jgi:5-methylcytosine-specific restriction endonuclease McrA